MLLIQGESTRCFLLRYSKSKMSLMKVEGNYVIHQDAKKGERVEAEREKVRHRGIGDESREPIKQGLYTRN